LYPVVLIFGVFGIQEICVIDLFRNMECEFRPSYIPLGLGPWDLVLECSHTCSTNIRTGIRILHSLDCPLPQAPTPTVPSSAYIGGPNLFSLPGEEKPNDAVPEPSVAAGSDEAHLDAEPDQPPTVQTSRGGYTTFAETNRYALETTYKLFLILRSSCTHKLYFGLDGLRIEKIGIHTRIKMAHQTIHDIWQCSHIRNKCYVYLPL